MIGYPQFVEQLNSPIFALQNLTKLYMQIIQTIRDKGAAIVIVVISLSLIGFILMDSSQSGGMFNPISTSIGEVNGTDIDLNDYNRKVRFAEMTEQQRSGQAPTGARTYQIREEVYNQIIAEKIFTDESNKLGIDLTAKELSYILTSDDPMNPLLQEQALRDPATGKLNIEEALKVIQNIKKSKDEQRENINIQLINPLKLSTRVNKYTAMLNAGAYLPNWMKKRDADFANQFAQIEYVNIPFYEIPDSTIKVTDADINAYVQKNKELFKQEKGKTISYITFSQLPNQQDSLRTSEELAKMVDEFAADTNATAFVAKSMSVIEFEDAYKPAKNFRTGYIDQILATPAGTVYGPYAENNNYVLAKMLGTKMLPDSVRSKHILIPTHNMQTGEMIREESVAKNLADSLLNAINNGSDFTTLAAQFSTDGSASQGGDLGTYGFGAMVPEFNDFTFNNPVGSRGVVRTQFGYHVIEVTNQKNFSPAYKIAFVAREIMAGESTINAASLSATKASALNDAKSLAEYAEKNGLRLVENPTLVKENDYTIGSIQDARGIVQWINDAKPGEVSEPFNIGNDFIVVTIDKAYKEGLQDAATARDGAEPMIIKEKKTEMIISKLGANPTLESAAAAYGKTIMTAGEDSLLTMSSQVVTGLGVEPKLIGASFNKAYQSAPSAPFAGTSGVYVVKVKSISTKPSAGNEEMLNQNRLNSLRGANNSWYESLRKLAKIKDDRSKHF